jgi:hypothetical protein
MEHRPQPCRNKIPRVRFKVVPESRDSRLYLWLMTDRGGGGKNEGGRSKPSLTAAAKRRIFVDTTQIPENI